jgi:hypothetical protein
MPINSGGMPKWRAVEAEPSTNRSALKASITKPKSKAKMAIIILYFCHYLVCAISTFPVLLLSGPDWKTVSE